VADRVGHIMNYGDGWYGGVYMAAMYSLAFLDRDIGRVVEEGLKVIPPGTAFSACIRDVIDCWRRDPSDWKKAWSLVEQKWSSDAGCPDFVLQPGDIDAKLNAAYVVIGLLYGGGDFGRTLEIAARCGEDSDCNPASAGGILGTMLGYRGIPAVWRDPVKAVENRPFAYTSMSLDKVYETSFRQALEMIRRNGGRGGGKDVVLPVRPIEPVRLEVSFPGCRPLGRRSLGLKLETKTEVAFEGTGYALCGGPSKMSEDGSDHYVYLVEAALDGGAPSVVKMPVSVHDRRLEVSWAYGLKNGKHSLSLRLLNPRPGECIRLDGLITYGDAPAGPGN
jgi:hypothetical protein